MYTCLHDTHTHTCRIIKLRITNKEKVITQEILKAWGFIYISTNEGVYKKVNCTICDGCLAQDCGICVNCRDKIRFGGPGCKKQKCLKWKCTKPAIRVQ